MHRLKADSSFALEQGQTDRRQAPAPAESRVVDQSQASDEGPQKRSCPIQPRHRQQIAWL